MIKWRKASRSNASGNECVEVAALPKGRAIRDSKAPEGGHLVLSAESFAQLVAAVKADEFDF
ncbi:DUF397 domain-containing protein [Actinomadura syzygii]|uniref:DUF397 domain-containing protein n=1 Tax=Actinomadura syzygii TaxID=1427538 RepID=A0A5D0UMG7_9ACTN|nr:DUF397 domain-containing protein [Actinomadura syzygii]TYC18319.1 DUF397 domain-containing protein [Actinomadura syzygii]